MSPNRAVNSDAFFVRRAHYKCTGYGWRYTSIQRAVGWAKAVRPCPRGFNDSPRETPDDASSLRVGTLRFAHPTLGLMGENRKAAFTPDGC